MALLLLPLVFSFGSFAALAFALRFYRHDRKALTRRKQKFEVPLRFEINSIPNLIALISLFISFLPAPSLPAQASQPLDESLPSYPANITPTPKTCSNFCPLPNNLLSDESHHSITSITVTGPSAPINNCDVVTFTIVAVNDTVTTTNVIITSTMPAGFSPTQVVFNVGTVGPGEVITRYAVFSATCSAVSGQNVVTLTQDGATPIVRYTDFVVNPGAITVRKEPAVIRAGLDDIVTWTVYVENTGYGNVYNVRVTDTLGSGLQYVSGLTSAYVISIPVGGVVTFPIAARVVGCSNLENVVTATWGCNGQACLTPQTGQGARWTWRCVTLS
jgi:uncharacterized repeat protein (TIGR01451 family)